MIWFDGILISLFERFSHRTQRTAGITSRHWTRFFALLSAFLVAIAVGRHSWFERFLDGVILVGCFIRFLLAESRKDENGSETLMNPNKINTAEVWYRVGMAAIAAILLSSDIFWPLPDDSEHYAVYSMVLLVYFDACDDLPRSKSRFRQWIESAARMLKKAEVAA